MFEKLVLVTLMVSQIMDNAFMIIKFVLNADANYR